jgi:hypothetical protein
MVFRFSRRLMDTCRRNQLSKALPCRCAANREDEARGLIACQQGAWSSKRRCLRVKEMGEAWGKPRPSANDIEGMSVVA